MLGTIEPVLLRPGHIDSVIKVGLPNGDARLQVFDICVKNLLQNGLMEPDVDVETIIRATQDLTVAHTERIIRLQLLTRCSFTWTIEYQQTRSRKTSSVQP